MRPKPQSVRSCIPYSISFEAKARIEEKRDKILADRTNQLDQTKQEEEMLEHEALAHSVEIELPTTRKTREQLASDPEFQRQYQQMIIQNLRNLTFTWNKVVEANKAHQGIDKNFLVRLQANVEPEALERTGYRSGSAEIDGQFVRVNPEVAMPPFLITLNGALKANDHIHSLRGTPGHRELHDFTYFGRGTPKMPAWNDLREHGAHPLDLATYAAMEFLYIHPFKDGNGRIARVLMNMVLQRYDFPVVVIPAGERELYLSQVRIGRQGLYAGMKRRDAFAPFGAYMADKVEKTLDSLLSGERTI